MQYICCEMRLVHTQMYRINHALSKGSVSLTSIGLGSCDPLASSAPDCKGGGGGGGGEKENRHVIIMTTSVYKNSVQSRHTLTQTSFASL